MTDTVSPSILSTIKKMLNIHEEDPSFDVDIIANVNYVLMVLNQLGVGPETPFSITDKSATWSSFLTDLSNLQAVKTYIYLKVRLVFDPPTNGFLVEAINKQITELEFRLNVQAEPRVQESIPIEEDV